MVLSVNDKRLGRREFGTRTFGLVAMALSTRSYGAPADGFPSKPISLVVPASPGGTTDIVARAFAQQVHKSLRQPGVVENKTGATGAIGAQYVARAAADGHTLLIGPSSVMAVNPLVQNVPYSTSNDFSIVGLLAKAETVIVANPAKGFRNLHDVIRYAKQHPGKLTFGSIGTGGISHVAMEYLQISAGIQMLHVPYKGLVQSETALLSNEIDILLTNTSAIEPHIRAGKVVPLAITSKLPWSGLRGVPHASEAVPGYVVETWFGVYVPSGTADARIGVLNATLNEFLRDPASIEMMRKHGLAGAPGTPAEALQFQSSEIERWKPVIATTKAAGRL